MTSGILARAEEIVEISEVQRILDAGEGSLVFTTEEWAFAFTKADPARRLAARYAAKKAVARLIGGAVALVEIEIIRFPGHPPRIALRGEARRALDAVGGGRLLVSLTHSRRHAAALVLLLPDEGS